MPKAITYIRTLTLYILNIADFKARFDDINDRFLARLYLLKDNISDFDDYSSQSQLILEEYEAKFRDAIVDI